MELTEQLFTKADDSPLVDAVAEVIQHRYPSIRLDELTIEEKTVIAVMTAQGILGNGGFRYLFEADFEDGACYTEIVDALRRIGDEESAQIVQQALHLFPNATPHTDLEARDRYLTHLYETRVQEAEQLDERFWERDPQTTQALARYIRAHRACFLVDTSA
jgi:hypothetical protein